MGTTLLEARHLGKSFGGVHAVRDVSFVVRAGETLGLIGPNGAGKTTTFELLGGFTRPDAGQVLFDRRDVSYARAGGAGAARPDPVVPGRRAVPDADRPGDGHARARARRADRLPRVDAGCRRSASGRKERQARAARRQRWASTAIATSRSRSCRPAPGASPRSPASSRCEPICLLLDEPSSGIAQRETEALGQLLVDLKRELDLTLVIIEHDIPLIMGISDRIVAMADGSIIAEGTPDVVRNDPARRRRLPRRQHHRDRALRGGTR